MKWVSSRDAGFITAGNAIEEAYRLQKEFLPLLNWWYENPYRLIDSEITYPKDIKRFVKYNNERSPRLHVLLKKIQSSPRKNENLLRGVRDKCVHRAKLFAAFPRSQRAKMDNPCKTKFLRDQASITARNWDFLLSFVEPRVRSMEFRLPHKF